MDKGKLANYFKYPGRYLFAVSGATGGFVIFAMTILITVDVLGRYLLGKPTMVAVEMSAYMLVALIFLGLAYTESQDRHVAITFITKKFSQRTQKILRIAITAISVVFIGWLVWFTALPVIQDFQIGTVSLTGTRTPIWIPSLLIPIGFTLFTFQLIIKLIGELKA